MRGGFRQHQLEADPQRAKYFYGQGEFELKTLHALVATVGPSGFEPINMRATHKTIRRKTTSSGVAGVAGGAGGDANDLGTHGDDAEDADLAQRADAYVGDDARRADGRVDSNSQGRLGVEWPWERP